MLHNHHTKYFRPKLLLMPVSGAAFKFFALVTEAFGEKLNDKPYFSDVIEQLHTAGLHEPKYRF